MRFPLMWRRTHDGRVAALERHVMNLLMDCGQWRSRAKSLERGWPEAVRDLLRRLGAVRSRPPMFGGGRVCVVLEFENEFIARVTSGEEDLLAREVAAIIRGMRKDAGQPPGRR